MTHYNSTYKLLLLFVLPALAFLYCSNLASAAYGKDQSPQEIGARLQEKYNKIRSLTFSFTQQTSGQLTGRSGSGSGTAFFLKNGNQSKMLWDYVSPEKQVILSDGVTLSMYFAKLNQMIIAPANSLQQDITYSFFSGAGDLENDFMIMPPDPEVGVTDTDRESFKIIKLVPRTPRSQVKMIHVWVTSDSLIQRMEIQDYFDTVTVLNFTNMKVDTLVGEPQQNLDALFSLTPPQGTEIIRQ